MTTEERLKNHFSQKPHIPDTAYLIGMRATIMDGAIIGRNSIIGAGSLVTPKTLIPSGSLAIGSPAKVVRQLSEEEKANIKNWALKYVKVAAAHKAKFQSG